MIASRLSLVCCAFTFYWWAIGRLPTDEPLPHVGLRMGEAMGLRWSDIDLDGQTLRVSRQLQSVREGGGLIFSDPKNASRPTVDLPQSALHALKGHRKDQAEERLRARDRPAQNELARFP
jgi:integrase